MVELVLLQQRQQQHCLGVIPVTTTNSNYLSISGQEITGGTVSVTSGGTGATTATITSKTNPSLEIPVTLANTNYLSISGQEITGGTVPVTSGGTGATTASAKEL